MRNMNLTIWRSFNILRVLLITVKSTAVLLFIGFTHSVFSQNNIQQWAFKVGGVYMYEYHSVNAVAADVFGNIYIAGDFYGMGDFDPGPGIANRSSSSGDMFVAKYNSMGEYQWAYNYYNAGADKVTGIATNINGDIYITGNFSGNSFSIGNFTLYNSNSDGSYDFFIAKLSQNGNVLWAKSGGGTHQDYSNAITTSSDGSLIITGGFYSSILSIENIILNNTGATDIFVVRYDANGNLLWAKSYIGNNTDHAMSIASDVNGNIYLTGCFQSDSLKIDNIPLINSGGGANDAFIIKLDTNGDPVWANSIGGFFAGEIGDGVNIDIDGNVLMTGTFQTYGLNIQNITLNNYFGGTDFFIVKFDPSGNVIWAGNGGGSAYDEANSITSDSDGNVYIAGFFQSPSMSVNSTMVQNENDDFSSDVFIIKYSSDGILQWVRNFGGPSTDKALCITTTNDGGICVAGNYQSSSITIANQTLTINGTQITDLFLAKLSSCGGYDFPVPICLITVDTLSTHNVIIWENPTTNLIDSFFVYREVVSNVYQKIASVSYNSVSEYHDFFANPNITSYNYKLSVLDTCGYETIQSSFHKTIHLQNLGNGNLLWNHYAIENQQNPVDFYRVYRDDFGTGNFLPISTTVPGGNNSYTDVNYSTFPNAKYLVDVAWNLSCDPFRDITTTRSNIYSLSTSISKNNLYNFEIFPNPASETVTIKFTSNLQPQKIEIFNALGELVLIKPISNKQAQEGKVKFNINNFSDGIYSVKISAENGSTNKKLLIR